MQISNHQFRPYNNFKIASPTPSFKGNDDKTSKQNNDPDVAIHPSIYFANKAFSVSNKMLSSEFGHYFGENSEPVDLTSEKDTAETFLINLKLDTDIEYDKIPKDKLSKVPHFFSTNSEHYLDNYLNSVMIADSYRGKIIDVFEDKLSSMESKNKEEEIFRSGLTQSIEEQKAINKIMNIDYSKVVEFIKEDKENPIDEILEKMDTVKNYSYWKALNAGFNRNPKGVINQLTSPIFMSVKPSVEDNGDGTSNYCYEAFFDVLKVKRNNTNGDYISFTVGYDNDLVGNFNEDGTIKDIVFKDDDDNSTNRIVPDSKTQAVEITTLLKNTMTKKKFAKQEDDTYKLLETKQIVLNS